MIKSKKNNKESSMKKSNLFGILSIVLAIAPLFISVPLLPLASIVMAIIGFAKDKSKVPSIIGIVINVASFLLGIITSILTLILTLIMTIVPLIIAILPYI